MIDNPRKFVIIVSSVVMVLVIIITFFQVFDLGSLSGNQNSTTTEKIVNETPKPRTSETRETSSPLTYETLVIYTDNGFSPGIIEVPAGTSVRFVNQSNGTMWVSYVPNQNSPQYTEFNQTKSLGKGGIFDFHFNKKGVWLYYNLNDKTKTGVVVVK